MAKQLNILQPLPGSDSLQFLLDIIRDQDQLAETLKTIEEHRERANKAVALVGLAQDIEAMHARIRSSEIEAETRVKTAKVAADKTIADAQVEADRIVAEATELEAGVKQARADADAASAAAERAIAQASSDTAGVAAREAECRKTLAAAQGMADQALAAKSLYEQKLVELQETLKRFGAG